MTTELIGRADVVRQLDDALERSADGIATTVCLIGEIGMGRSTLLADLRARALGAGATVLSTTGRAADSDIGFSGLFSLMRPVETRIDELAGDQAGALQAALSLSTGTTDPAHVRLGLFRLLTNLAVDTPVVVTLDDAHLLDRSSWDALSFTIGRLDADHVTVVVSIEPTSTLAEEIDGQTILLDPLTDEELGDLIDSRAELAAEVRSSCLALSSGNPLVAVEMIRSLSDGQRLGLEPLPAIPAPPTALARGFEAALAAVPSHLWPPLVVIAADVTADIGVVERVLADLDQSTTTLDELEQTGFIEIDGQTIHFGHPLLAQFVLYRSSARSRRAAHRSLASALDQPHQLAARAWHLAAASDGPDEEAAATLAVVADDVFARGGAASAARAYERAAELSPENSARTVRYIEALRCWLAVGDVTSVGRVTAALESGAAAEIDVGSAVAVGLRWTGGEHRVVAGLESAVAAEIDDERRREYTALLADARAATGDRAGALEAAETLATGGDTAAALSRAVIALLAGETDLRQEATVEPGTVIAARLRLRTAEAFVARGEVADALVALGPAEAASSWDPAEEEAVRARALVLSGEIGTAFELLNRRLDQLPRGADLPRAVLLTALAEVELLMGRSQSASEHLHVALPRLQTANAFGDVLRGRRTAARLALADGDVDRTVSELLLSVGRAPEYLSVELAAALLMLGRNEEAARLFGDEIRRELDGPLPSVRAKTTAGLLDDDDELLQSAALDADRNGLVLEAAEIHLHRAEAASRGGRATEVPVLAAEATARLTSIGAGGWGPRIQRLVDAPRNEARKRVADQLTEAEHRVAVTVAVGRTNKEAAAELFLSQKTIDYHLQNIYRKLELRGRTELAALLSQGD